MLSCGTGSWPAIPHVGSARAARAHRPNKIEISVRGGAIRPIFSLRAGLACPVDVPLRARVPVAPRAPPPRRADARGSPPAAPIRARSRKPGNVRRGAQPTATGTSTRDPNVARAGYAGQCRAMRRKGTRGARSPEMVLGGGRPMTARRRTKAAPSTATKSTGGRPAPIRPRSHGPRWVFEGTARPRPGCARGPRAVVATPRALPRRRFRMLVDDGRRSKTRCVPQISRSCADRVSSPAKRAVALNGPPNASGAEKSQL